MTKCQHKNVIETPDIAHDRHGRPYAQNIYECADCKFRWMGERINYAAHVGRGRKDPRQKDRLGR